MEDTVIKIENFSYSYPPVSQHSGPVKVLNEINLVIRRGEFVSVMGPTGAGKTTLCLAINGIVPHSTGGSVKGNVYTCGMNTRETEVSDLAQKVGVVFQDPETQLFTMSVEDEVAFGLECLGTDPKEMDMKIDHVLSLVGISEMRKRSPFHLSGGQKQRVAIAAILAMEPDIIILDEPTSGLDPVGKSEVFEVIEKLRRDMDKTVIMIEQESEQIARFSDRLIILEDGQITMDDSPRKVFNKVDELHSVGVSVPQVTELAALYSADNVSESRVFPVTIEEAVSWF